MGTFRTVVLPILRLLVWTVIAVSLAALAFGGGADRGDAISPQVQTQQSLVPVTKADIRSVIQVTGTVNADPAIKIKSTTTGTVSKLRVSVGDTVEEGTTLFDVTVQLPPTPGKTITAPDGTVTTTPDTPRSRTDQVKSTAVGVVSVFDLIKGQEVAVGADVASIDPQTLTVKAPLTQAQQFRLLTPPAAAQAQAPGGPAPFSCPNLSTGAAAATANAQQNIDPATGQMMAASTAEVRCTVPPGTTVFAGMSVEVTIDTGSVQGVLALPVTAVQGTVGTGKVWVDGASGPVEKPVVLGLTDGTLVQVVSGLVEGDQVLEFAPVPDDDSGSTPQAPPTEVVG